MNKKGIKMISRFLPVAMICLCAVAHGSLVPQNVVDSNIKAYDALELALIKEDLLNIDRLVFRERTPSKQPYYIGTAGGPGACKSTILETILHEDSTVTNVAYIDPDPQSLRFMINTYLAKGLSFYQISKKSSFRQAQIDAYNHWRGGSNYIAQTLLNKAVDGKFNIAHGTTATAPIMGRFYETLKKHGYKIHLVLCYAEDEARGRSIAHRVETQANYQATPEDAINKGKMFPERFEVYFKYADTLRLYWTCDFSQGSREVARIEGGKLTIKDAAGYERFVNEYKRACAERDDKLPTWDALLKLQGIS